MKRSLLALAIGLAFLTAGVASAEQSKSTGEKKAACCATKSADGAKVCAHEGKADSCCKGEESKSCCPADCCSSHKDKTAKADTKRSDGDQKSASCCAGGSCCKSESC
jgi:hypothetical protein